MTHDDPQRSPSAASSDAQASILSNPKIAHVLRIRRNYKPSWGWGAGAKYLYRELIRAWGLQEYETALMHVAKPKPGPKRDEGLARLISILKKDHGLTVPEITKFLGTDLKPPTHRSEEAVSSYLKSRRRPRI